MSYDQKDTEILLLKLTSSVIVSASKCKEKSKFLFIINTIM